MVASRFDTPIDLDRDSFMRQLISNLGHLNEGILGSDVAGAYVLNVGLSMGAAIEAEYKRHWGIDRPFTVEEYGHVIVDLKQKIHGNFSLIGASEDFVEVTTTSCPFEDVVRQSPSLCFMTSSVFGGIAARNFGYAKVVLHRRIALGDDGCHVTIHLRPTEEAKAAIGREYYPEEDRAAGDIAEQLRLMEEVRDLRQSLERTTIQWEELFATSPDALCLADEGGSVVFANAQWRDLIGVEGAELLGGELTQIAFADDRPWLTDQVRQILAGERKSGIDLRVRHRSGSERWASMSGTPLLSKTGAVYGALVLFHDITQRVEMERLKEEFLQASSHELRTPVTTIRGMTQYLLRSLDQGQFDPELLRDRLSMIQDEADRLVLLGTDLSDALNLRSSRRVRIEPEVVDLGEMLEGVVQRYGESLGSKVVLERPAAETYASIDPQRITQVLDNLITNAQKYSPEGGEITVSLSAEDDVLIHVADQGIGIPEDQLESVFEPFTRASNVSSLNFPGTGLGLYLSRAIAEAHNGRIEVESELGRGTTFTVVIPKVFRAV